MKTKTIVHLLMLVVILFGQLPIQASAQGGIATGTPGMGVSTSLSTGIHKSNNGLISTSRNRKRNRQANPG